MSKLTKEGPLSVKALAKVPGLLDLPFIEHAPPSVSASSREGTNAGIELSEGCFVTKSIKYTHQLTHFVNADHANTAENDKVRDRLLNLGVVPYINFHLGDPCNLAFLEAFVHSSLDRYAFIAITASSATLEGLRKMVQSDNDRRQQVLDKSGVTLRRTFDFSVSSFVNPEYELVALHPEHFLPGGAVLTVYGPGLGNRKDYVPAADRRLRESYDSNSAPFPSFSHSSNGREVFDRLNVFLVIINAEIKFRRYFEMIQQNPPDIPLPDDVLSLMRRTMDLVDLIYWEPKPLVGSAGEAKLLRREERQQSRRRAPPRQAQDRPPPVTDMSGQEIEMQTDDDEDMENMASGGVRSLRRTIDWENADMETRRAYGTALMSGHDLDYDPSLFEDAFPVNDTHLYSEPAAVEAWKQDASLSD